MPCWSWRRIWSRPQRLASLSAGERSSDFGWVLDWILKWSHRHHSPLLSTRDALARKMWAASMITVTWIATWLDHWWLFYTAWVQSQGSVWVSRRAETQETHTSWPLQIYQSWYRARLTDPALACTLWCKNSQSWAGKCALKVSSAASSPRSCSSGSHHPGTSPSPVG